MRKYITMITYNTMSINIGPLAQQFNIKSYDTIRIIQINKDKTIYSVSGIPMQYDGPKFRTMFLLGTLNNIYLKMYPQCVEKALAIAKRKSCSLWNTAWRQLLPKLDQRALRALRYLQASSRTVENYNTLVKYPKLTDNMIDGTRHAANKIIHDQIHIPKFGAKPWEIMPIDWVIDCDINSILPKGHQPYSSTIKLPVGTQKPTTILQCLIDNAPEDIKALQNNKALLCYLYLCSHKTPVVRKRFLTDFDNTWKTIKTYINNITAIQAQPLVYRILSIASDQDSFAKCIKHKADSVLADLKRDRKIYTFESKTLQKLKVQTLDASEVDTILKTLNTVIMYNTTDNTPYKVTVNEKLLGLILLGSNNNVISVGYNNKRVPKYWVTRAVNLVP